MILQGKTYTIDKELCNLLTNHSDLFTIENKYTGHEIEEAIVRYITYHKLWTSNENESIYVNDDLKNMIGDIHLVFVEDLYHKLIHRLTIV